MKKHHGDTEDTEKNDNGNMVPPCSPCLRGEIVLFILLIAFLIRVVVLLLMSDGLRNDTDGYGRLAANLVEYGTFGDEDVPTAYRPPLYPLLLTGCAAMGDYGLKAVGVLHVVLGLATVGLVLVLGHRWGLGRGGAAAAALLVACDPILLASSAQVMTETLATFLATAGLLVLTWAGRRTSSAAAGTADFCQVVADVPSAAIENQERNAMRLAAAGTAACSGTGPTCRRPLNGRCIPILKTNKLMAAGAVLALGALCRPELLLWTIAAGVLLWVRSRRGTGSAIAGVFRVPVAFVLGVLIVLSPWMIRNKIQFGWPISTTSHGGYTLLLANNPEFYQWLREGAWGSVWRADKLNAEWESRRPSDEIQADRQAYAEAWHTIAREPGTFAYSCLVRLGRFWSPLPHQTTADETPLRRLSRYAVAAWYLLEFMCAAFGVWRMGGGERGERREERGQESPAALALPPSPFPLRSSPWLWGLLLVACLTAAHTIYWTDMRMRAPLMPVAALAAAWAFCGRPSRAPPQSGSRQQVLIVKKVEESV